MSDLSLFCCGCKGCYCLQCFVYDIRVNVIHEAEIKVFKDNKYIGVTFKKTDMRETNYFSATTTCFIGPS